MADVSFTHDRTASASDYLALLKPRVMSLVVFTGLVGYMAAPGPGDFVLGFAAILSIAVAAGASGALNMWFDSDIDAVMTPHALAPDPRRPRAARRSVDAGADALGA